MSSQFLMPVPIYCHSKSANRREVGSPTGNFKPRCYNREGGGADHKVQENEMDEDGA